MSKPLNIVVCGSLVPDPLQTLEPVQTPQGPGLKNEQMLPSVLDPWAACALYEAAALAKTRPGSKVTLVALGPKAKLQQLMMTVAQFGGCASASRDAGVTLQFVAEALGITEFFNAVDELKVADDDSFTVKERIEGGQYLVSTCTGLPAAIGWATGSLPEPPNNPQTGMMNMRGVMPALMKAPAANVGTGGIAWEKAEVPASKRETVVKKDMSVEDIAKEIVEWIKA